MSNGGHSVALQFQALPIPCLIFTSFAECTGCSVHHFHYAMNSSLLTVKNSCMASTSSCTWQQVDCLLTACKLEYDQCDGKVQ